MTRSLRALACVALALTFAGCNPQGSDNSDGPAAAVPAWVTGNPPTGIAARTPAVGTNCHSDNGAHICLGLKYVVYRDSTGAAITSESQVAFNVDTINSIYSQCDIGFQVDEYDAVDPATFKLKYRTADLDELEDVRNAFEPDDKLLVVTTGTWDRTGTLGNTPANAWTNLPEGGPFGVVLERPVATYPNLVGHELGHYLNLLHVSDTTDLMNPIVYDRSVKLTAAQCHSARAAATYFWGKMLR